LGLAPRRPCAPQDAAAHLTTQLLLAVVDGRDATPRRRPRAQRFTARQCVFCSPLSSCLGSVPAPNAKGKASFKYPRYGLYLLCVHRRVYACYVQVCQPNRTACRRWAAGADWRCRAPPPRVRRKRSAHNKAQQ
jgi:hypothetical protein